MLTAWEIHELILEDIEEKSSNIMPSRIQFGPGGDIPEGVYEPNIDNVWVWIDTLDN